MIPEERAESPGNRGKHPRPVLLDAPPMLNMETQMLTVHAFLAKNA
jgi:hypothetical protein